MVACRVCWFEAATKKQKYEKISDKKMSTPVEILCKVRQLFSFVTAGIQDLHWGELSH